MALSTAKKKNLVLIHLESISNTTLWQYRSELATVWSFLRKSLYFSRFYVSSTSTSMSIHSLLAGNDAINDAHATYQGSSMEHAQIFGVLAGDFTYSGYIWKHFALENISPHKSASVDEPALGLMRSSYLNNLLIMFRDWLTKMRQNDAHFAIHFQNDVTHMASNEDGKTTAASFQERFRIAFQSLDHSIKLFLALLEEYGFLKDSVVVFYGDHGDEFWSHKLSRGFCHGIEPYGSLVWTPLFIYDNGENAGTTDEVLSIVDLREMLLKMLIPEAIGWGFLTGARKSPFSGIDREEKKRTLAFSQNLYALQLEYSDIEKALTKGYSVTDGIYRLVVSSGGKREKEGGLEFFYDRLDPSNSRNLLDFFILDSSGNIVALNSPPLVEEKPFSILFSPETIPNLINVYHHLKSELYAYVRLKETEAIKHNTGQRHVMPESAFRFARKRLRRDYND